MKKSILVTILIVVLMCVFLTGVASAKEYSILIMPKLIGIPYFNASEEGALKAGKDLGVDVIYAGPTKCDAAAQVKMIEDYISRGVDAICIAPNDPAALTPVLKKAKSKGILILDWDTPADKDVVDYSIHQIDDKIYGEHIWDLFVQELGKDEGDYIVLTGGLDAQNLNCWIDYGIEHAKKVYPKLNLLTERIPTNENQQEAYMATLNVLKAYPKLDGLICISSPAPIGAAQAVQEKGKKDEIVVVGITVPSEANAYLKSGDLKIATLWDPSLLGYLTIYVAYQALEGNEIYDGMEVPNVGKIQLKEDGKTVIMGPPTDFTAENVDQFAF